MIFFPPRKDWEGRWVVGSLSPPYISQEIWDTVVIFQLCDLPLPPASKAVSRDPNEGGFENAGWKILFEVLFKCQELCKT